MDLIRRVALVLSSAIVLSVAGSALAHGALFFSGGYRAFPAQPASASAQVGDFNEDGWLDVVSGSDGSGSSVSILIGNGVGALLPATSITVGIRPRSVAVADLNGDGHLDFVTANAGSGTISIRPGQGEGGFASGLEVSAGTSPWVVVLADLDRDGDLDLVVLDASGEALRTIPNNGGGSFGPVSFTRLTNVRPRALAIGDLDGDLYPDAVVGSIGEPLSGFGASLTSYRGNGNGSFGTAAIIQQSLATAVGIADLDADGKNDVVANGVVYYGNGNGTFTPPGGGGSANFYLIALGDVDGNGVLDVMTAVTGKGVWVSRGLGGRAFAPAENFGVGCEPLSVALGDLNGDGRTDLITAAASSVATLLNSNGSFGTIFRVNGPIGGVAAADLNHDGKADLVYTDRGGRYAVVNLGNGDGTFGPRTDFSVGSFPGAIAIADLTGDGHPDLVVANPNSDNTISVLPGLGDGTFGPRLDQATGEWPYDLQIADLDRDGHLDVAVGYYGGVTLLRGAGGGTFVERRDFAFQDYQNIAVGDFDGDGDPDLATSSNTTGTTYVRTWINSGNGLDYTIAAIYSGSSIPQSEDLAVGDLDGNGTLDLVTGSLSAFYDRCNGTSPLVVFSGLGDGSFVQQPIVQFPPELGSFAIRDLDGDGRSDLLAISAGAGAVVAVGNGTLAGGQRYAFGGGAAPAKHAIADFNNDGSPDLALLDRGTATVVVLMNRSALLGVEPGSRPPTLRLGPAFPNPAVGLVRIPFTLPVATHAQLRILDAQGRLVRTLLDGALPAGPHALHWDCATAAGRRVTPGMYFYELLTNGERRSGRVVVVE